jgi:hypothetical protein
VKRRDDWPQRLAAAFAAARGRVFAEGEHDCCLHAADCIEAVTGVDLAARWRGAYATQADGMALTGVRSLAALPRKLGLEAVAPALAHRGDVALARVGGTGRDRPTLMVFDGAQLRGPCGQTAPRSAALRAWKVGW